MSIVVETINDQGELVEVSEPPPDAPAPSPAAPPSEAPPAESAPAPDPPAAPPGEAPPAESAPALVSPSEDEDSRDVPRGVQKRFDTLTRQREEARREAQAMREQMAQVQGQLEMLTRVQRESEPQPVPLHQQPPPQGENYASQEEWLEARDAWNEARILQKVVMQQHQQAAEAEARTQAEALHAREEAIQAQHGDYYDRIAQLRTVMTPVVEQALLAHELGPDLAYYLAQHPDEARRLHPLPPLSVWRELAKLEGRLDGNGTTPPRSPAVPSSSAPKPAPLTPVGSGGSGAPVPSLDDPNLSQREWETAAERQYPGIWTRRR